MSAAPGFVVCKLAAAAPGEVPVCWWLNCLLEWTAAREGAFVWTVPRGAFAAALEAGSGVVMETAAPIALPVKRTPSEVYEDLEKRGLA